MKYKSKFPQTEFQKMNSFMCNFCIDYTPIADGKTMCTSNMSFSPRRVIFKDVSPELHEYICGLFIAPNTTRSATKDLKKTKMYVTNNKDFITFYDIRGEITDDFDSIVTADLSDAIKRFDMANVWSIPRANMDDVRYLSNEYQKILSDMIESSEFKEIDVDEVKSKFKEDSHVEVSDGVKTIIVTKQCFPNAKSLTSLSWNHTVDSEGRNIAIFRSEYDIAYVYSLFVFIDIDE